MLDWSRFQSLSGDATDNFEKLCRGVVRRQFGNLGPLHELKNQPGVEFYITLNQGHSGLANQGETVGWQSKWFTYKANGELTSNGKTQILHSLDKTVEHVSHINHWYLWTHQTLSKVDQEWYFGLQQKYNFTLHLWNQNDLDTLLSGPALDLRNTYFGELALTAEMLSDQHSKSVAPIKSRWLHDVHQQMSAELEVRQILGEAEAWEESASINRLLSKVCEDIEISLNIPEYSRWAAELSSFYELCKAYIKHCEFFENNIYGQDIEDLKLIFGDENSKFKKDIFKASIQIRSQNLPLSLSISNAFAYIKDARNLFESAIEKLSKQCVVILADAGGGKTQLAAELTAPSSTRPAGILILGRSLKKNMGLNDLAKNFTFYQNQVNNFEALVAAVDAVGDRSKRRLPIVIDGLNEAQDPREWKILLESILPLLRKYLNVVLVCTLRTSEKVTDRLALQQRHMGRESAAHNSIPDSAYLILSEGYDEELTTKAIKSYFERYKIHADPFTAPLNFFSHPLNLKIFCEVTNRKRASEVNISYFPSSIYSLFRAQICHTVDSIADMPNLDRTYQKDEVERAIYLLGEIIWEGNSRFVKEEVFKQKINLPLVDWNSDFVNLFSQEGIVFRDEGDESFTYELTPVYDRLGGFIVAEYLIKKNKKLSLNDWVSESSFIEKLFGDINSQHPLSEDILHALIVLIPKTIDGQLWKEVPTEIRSSVLAKSYLIDKDDFCEETISEYQSLIISEGISNRDIEQLVTLIFAIHHPFNGEFLNKILLTLPMAERDLTWTEYLRSQAPNLLRVLDAFLKRLRSGQTLNPDTIRIRMLLLSWYLTSTVAELRDAASESLLEVGKLNPDIFFEVVSELLNVNDPYVLERLLGAAYAVITILVNSKTYEETILGFSRKIYYGIFTANAPYPTTHIIARDYASCLLKMVRFHFESAKEFDPNIFSHPFSQLIRKPWGCVNTEKKVHFSISSPFRMDFENYTIGRLIKDRSNYDYSHVDYKSARGNILWRVYDLGWSHERFEKVEGLIQTVGHNYSRAQRPTVERYGKKYSWIAYYELAGSLQDQGKLDSWGSRFYADIDPFFPKETECSELNKHSFISDNNVDNKDWVNQSNLPDLDMVLEIRIADHQWVLLHGFISEESRRLDRSFNCSIDTAFISEQDFNLLEHYKSEQKRMRWPEQPSLHYIYTGELYSPFSNDTQNDSSIEVEIGHETRTVERPNFYLDDKRVQGGSFVEEWPLFSNLKLFPTIIKYYWENSHSSRENISQLVIVPWIVKELGLQFNPTNFNYSDPTGKSAVLNIQLEKNSYANNRNLIYLRKDLFEQLKANSGNKFIYRIYGERRFARAESFGGADAYKEFEVLGVESMS